MTLRKPVLKTFREAFSHFPDFCSIVDKYRDEMDHHIDL